jgi:HEPN domain-containing protein
MSACDFRLDNTLRAALHFTCYDVQKGLDCVNGIEQQVLYWLRSSRQDLRVADLLLKQHKNRHGLFFLHLAMEKLLKALVCQKTRQPAPRIHSLPSLAQRAAVQMSADQFEFLAAFDRFNIAGRYPDDLIRMPRNPQALKLVHTLKKVYRCLIGQLST